MSTNSWKRVNLVSYAYNLKFFIWSLKYSHKTLLFARNEGWKLLMKKHRLVFEWLDSTCGRDLYEIPLGV